MYVQLCKNCCLLYVYAVDGFFRLTKLAFDGHINLLPGFLRLAKLDTLMVNKPVSQQHGLPPFDSYLGGLLQSTTTVCGQPQSTTYADSQSTTTAELAAPVNNYCSLQ